MCFAAHQRRYRLRWSRELELLSLQKKLFVGDNLKKKVILVLIVFSCLRIYYKFSFNTLIIWGVKIWTLNVSVENTSRNQLLELQNFWLVCCHLECQDINFFWGWFENWKKKLMGIPLWDSSYNACQKKREKGCCGFDAWYQQGLWSGWVALPAKYYGENGIPSWLDRKDDELCHNSILFYFGKWETLWDDLAI